MLATIWVMVMLLLVLWVFGAPRKLAPVRVSDGAEGDQHTCAVSIDVTAPRRHRQGGTCPRHSSGRDSAQGRLGCKLVAKMPAGNAMPYKVQSR